MSNQFLMPSKVYLGKNALIDCFNTIQIPGKKALLVTDESMVKFGYVNTLIKLLEIKNTSYEIFDQVNFEPTDNCVMKGLELYQSTQCDFLIGLGGGSPLDAMKAIAMIASSDKPLTDYTSSSFEQTRPSMIAIPTTAGTGSETTQFTIITDTKRDIKMLLKGSKVLPDIAIIDPSFTLSAPSKVTASTGIDALCHAVEAYTSKKAQPLSSLYALDAIKKIFVSLPLCFSEPSNIDAREQMSIAAFEAGCAFNNASVTLIHGMSRPIGANFHIPHGLSNAVLMYSCLKYVENEAQDQFATIAREINCTTSLNDRVACTDFFNALNNLLKTLYIPDLKDIIDDKDQFKSLIDKISKDAYDSGSPSNSLRNITVEDIQTIYTDLIN
ncbi:iron-containing alcohol dehydrogenase [Anaerorhabdus sp.]|uniref:iron-containing alcohol dehydrogenase n=1 Tax=Anaerorhabdus sp. TaxID=1872524 RepID=UPI002FC7359B